VYVRMCWLKAIAGGWCTSHRLAEPVKLSCVFGCEGEKDNFHHYILCPSMWHICAEALGGSAPVDIADRLCLSNISTDSLKLLALAHGVYHATKNDSFCLSHNACIRSRAEIQKRACGFAKAGLVLVQGMCHAADQGNACEDSSPGGGVDSYRIGLRSEETRLPRQTGGREYPVLSVSSDFATYHSSVDDDRHALSIGAPGYCGPGVSIDQ
jgi:hypothetical protein